MKTWLSQPEKNCSLNTLRNSSINRKGISAVDSFVRSLRPVLI
jgi:hypothetical protein